MKRILKKLKPFLKNKNIVDIVLFGSFVKGRLNPDDIDIAVLQKEEELAIISQIKKLIPSADVQIILFEEYFSKLSLVLFKEGYSLKQNKFIYDNLGLSPLKLYTYSLKDLTQSKKVMFNRGLKLIKGITRLSNGVILVPVAQSSAFDDFLKHWNLDIDSREYELMPLLRKEQL